MTKPPVTVNAAEVAPDATATEAGVANDALLSDSVTVAPPLGAAAVSVTVQVEVPPEAIDDGAQLKPETLGTAARILIAPAEPANGIKPPFGATPRALLTEMGTLKMPDFASVRVTAATTPLPMVVAFMPLATHLEDPGVVLQVRLLPAEVKAAPAPIVTEATAVGLYEIVHCRAAASPFVDERLRETVPPRAAEPEAKLKVWL